MAKPRKATTARFSTPPPLTPGRIQATKHYCTLTWSSPCTREFQMKTRKNHITSTHLSNKTKSDNSPIMSTNRPHVRLNRPSLPFVSGYIQTKKTCSHTRDARDTNGTSQAGTRTRKRRGKKGAGNSRRELIEGRCRSQKRIKKVQKRESVSERWETRVRDSEVRGMMKRSSSVRYRA